MWARRSDTANHVEVPVKMVGGRVRVTERRVKCIAGCGSIAVDTLEYDISGRAYRIGKRKYERTRPYSIAKLDRTSDGDAGRPVTAADIAYAIAMRVHPDLRW